ncbi:MAG TPA: cytochrome b N-terminal domain-containing protein, partial [Desulfobacterales bacterium]|nr:cytochrome b N-terminal domain-containing protein [Desulfobacterales bacterium]
VLLQLFSWTLLKFVYEPVPTQAYDSLVHLQEGFLFGRLVRNMHFWSANLLVVVVCLHGLRVFFSGGFHPPRRLNWVVGLSLFILLLLSNLTGYLLPWNQLAYWATTISVGVLEYIPLVGSRLQQIVLGGPQIGPATLRNFFALHTAVFPALIVMLMAFHFWRVRKAGGLVIPRAPAEEPEEKPAMVPTHPDLLLREAAMALAAIAGVLVLSLISDAPIGEPANPGLSPNPTKAPWYFAGIQELLVHFHPSFALLIAAALVFGLFCLPYLDYAEAPAGVWFASATGRRTALIAAAAAAVATLLVVALDEYALDTSTMMPHLPQVISLGLLPTVLLAGALAGLYAVMVKKFQATRLEAVQAVFVFLAVGWVLLTATCVFFRGQGMKLRWPF